MAGSVSWSGTLTALSSIAHGGETRGTITLLRRELLALPGGETLHVPIVSGNTLRGRLRRVGEELLRNVLRPEGELHPAAAHALRGGGSLAKSSHEPLSGSRLQTLRTLVPQIGVFGAAGGGVIIDGALDVGKVVPHLAETNHITGAAATVSAFDGTQLEAYARQDDDGSHDFAGAGGISPGTPTASTAAARAAVSAVAGGGGQDRGDQMRFHVETFPMGTVFSTWLRLRRPTDLELAFFLDVLAEFTADGRLGGRVGIGHGRVRVDLAVTAGAAAAAAPAVDWRAFVVEHRAEALTALKGLV